MKTKILIAMVIIIALGGGAYAYFSRPVEAPSEIPTESQETVQGETVYRISGESTVEFRINEILRDKPFTAVGTTHDISGDIAVDGETIAFGPITVNARTFKTDSQQRDGAIARLILKSESSENELIVFKPNGVKNMTATGFTLTGDLTVSGVTKPAAFDVVLGTKDNALVGTAVTTLKRSDFNLTIPNIPFVASVDDEFTVKANVIAEKVK